MKNSFWEKAGKILPVIGIIVAMGGFFLIYRNKNQVSETVRLPYYGTKVEQVADGSYEGKAYTSYLHVQLKVTVKDKTITDIQVIENEGSKGQKVLPLIDEMILQNKTSVPVVKGEELASMVFISCVDDALRKGVVLEDALEKDVKADSEDAL